MLVAKEEHERHRVVEFVHLFEVGHLVEIADVDYGEVLDAVSDAWKRGLLATSVLEGPPGYEQIKVKLKESLNA